MAETFSKQRRVEETSPLPCGQREGLEWIGMQLSAMKLIQKPSHAQLTIVFEETCDANCYNQSQHQGRRSGDDPSPGDWA